MVTLDEKTKRNYSPGEIVYVNSNFSRTYDCFGVVVEKDFWDEQVKKENVFTPVVNDIIEDEHNNLERQVLFRVLGSRLFRQYWKSNDPNEIEPHEEVLMNYRCQWKGYVDPVDLKPLIKLSKKAAGNVGEILLNGDYTLGALEDAETIYAYLDGKRFEPSDKHVSSEDKLLRLLEQAIPMK